MTKARILELAVATDSRGLLAAGQYPDHLPFVPSRVFIVAESPAATERGGHAHRECNQVLIATAGSVRVELDDDEGTCEIILDHPTRALLIPALVWAKQTYLDDGASLVVLASHPYDVDDYVDDREESALLRAAATAPSDIR